MSQDVDQSTPEAIESMSQPSHHSDSETNINGVSDPFASPPDSAFFDGAERRVLLDEVIHLCQFGNNIVAALGDKGVGKTAFLSQACYELAETAFCCFITGDQSTTADDIFTQIISQLELPVAPTSSVGEMIATLRHSLAEGNLHRVVIIIDDADYLSEQILSALMSLLQGHQGNHLHILLGGEKNLVQRLDQFDIVDVLVYDVILNPLLADEIQDYLDFKLSASGYQHIGELGEEQIDTILRETGGYPGAINQVAPTLLFQQDIGEEEEPRRTGLPLMHMSLLVVLLAALIMALFYMGGDDKEGVEEFTPEISLVQPEAGPPVTDATSSTPQANDQPVENSPVPDTAKANEKSELASTEIKKAASEQPAVSQADNQQSKPVQKTTSETPELKGAPASSTAPANSNDNKPAKEGDVAKIKESFQQELKKEAEVLRNQNAAKPQKQKVESSTNKSESSTRSVVNSAALSADENALLALPDDYYTLQVIAASQEAGVRKFMSAQPNQADLKLVRVNRNGKPWYVVLVGYYEGVSLARQSIQSLPQAQVNAGPWPRKISDIKREIEAFRGR